MFDNVLQQTQLTIGKCIVALFSVWTNHIKSYTGKKALRPLEFFDPLDPVRCMKLSRGGGESKAMPKAYLKGAFRLLGTEHIPRLKNRADATFVHNGIRMFGAVAQGRQY